MYCFENHGLKMYRKCDHTMDVKFYNKKFYCQKNAERYIAS